MILLIRSRAVTEKKLPEIEDYALRNKDFTLL